MSGCQDLARMGWAAYARRKPLFVGRDLLICEWRCHGEARSWFPTVTEHSELDLPRHGLHLRRAAGKQRHLIDPTTAAFNRAQGEYTRASPTDRPATSTLIAVRGELAEALLSRVPRHDALAHRISPEAAALHFRLLRAIDPIAREETAIALLGSVLAEGPAPSRTRVLPPSWRRLSQEIQHAIATRFGERLTLEAIATSCRTSPFHASRVFRAVTGETIHRHLVRVRLRTALFDLQRGEGRLTEIALRTGFSSHSHFTSAFRAEFGYPPGALARAR